MSYKSFSAETSESAVKRVCKFNKRQKNGKLYDPGKLDY